MSFLIGTCDRVVTFATGMLFAQIPQFIQHYIQYLSGRVDEARVQVEKMRDAAALSHKSLEAFIQKFKVSPDPDFSQQGIVMEQIVSRYHELGNALVHVEASEGWMRPLAFFRYFDWEIAKNTFPHLTPGVPITLEAGLYALCGLFVGHLLFTGLKKCFSSLLFKRQVNHP